MSGHMKSFQVPRNVKIASVTRIGLSAGNDDRHENPKFARAIDARRLEHLVRDRESVLADEHNAENGGEHRR